MSAPTATSADRRKQVRLLLRRDLDTTPQKYEGKTHYVVKDPVSLRYYRFNDQEHYVITLFDGKHTLEQAQKEFERRFRPHRLSLEDLEAFARQLLTAGLVQHETAHASKHLYDRRKKQRRLRRIATFTNILYIKVPVFDPDRLLARMVPYLRWIFTTWFFLASVGLMLSAIALVATHYRTFWDKLPNYQEFFRFNTFLYMWIALGVVKVIHEFGHGLSCKAFGGECHEMGALFMCLSPALYCNVSDSWTLPNKWKRIIISFAGIYVELIIAAIATWVWWYTPGRPFVNNVALCLMILCSVSTVVFNANPLMRFDGYYMLADWLEIPNLRDRSNKYLQRLFTEHCLGIEAQPEPYMKPSRRVLFLVYAVVSYVYRWVITVSILWFLSGFLKPYKLGSLSMLLAIAAGASMIIWPLYRMGKNLQQRGRLPDMKRQRVTITAGVFAALLLGFVLLPLPISRVHQTALVQVQPDNIQKVFAPGPGVLEEVFVRDGELVQEGQLLARFYSQQLQEQLDEATMQAKSAASLRDTLRKQRHTASNLGQKLPPELMTELNKAESEAALYEGQRVLLAEQTVRLAEVRAPRDGYVMGLPRKDELHKAWDVSQGLPLCSIGDQQLLQLLVPVSPAEYRLLQDDLERNKMLEVSVHAPGASRLVWDARVTELPESDAKEVPVQLTQRGGGPLAVKPSEKPNVFVPQGQQYLVMANLVEPDETIVPGGLAKVKIHCRWRSGAWWCWRAISSSLDLGLI